MVGSPHVDTCDPHTLLLMKKTPLKRKTPLRATSLTVRKNTQNVSSIEKKGKRALKRKNKRNRGIGEDHTMAWYKKKLDSVFSAYIRQKYAHTNGLVKCYTCSTVKHWKEMQCGHWIPRNNLATRFSEENCRVQCVGCNMFQKGKPDVFAVNLIQEGIDIVALQQSRYSVFKIDTAWYIQMIEKYKTPT
jgi:Bacteriophage Lambda NinG protein